MSSSTGHRRRFVIRLALGGLLGGLAGFLLMWLALGQSPARSAGVAVICVVGVSLVMSQGFSPEADE